MRTKCINVLLNCENLKLMFSLNLPVTKDLDEVGLFQETAQLSSPKLQFSPFVPLSQCLSSIVYVFLVSLHSVSQSLQICFQGHLAVIAVAMGDVSSAAVAFSCVGTGMDNISA